METQGTIKVIGKTETFGNNGFQKRELVIETDEQYKQTILIEFVQDKCALLDAYSVGQSVKIGINLRGREWVNPQGETKYFNSVQGWRIDKAENAPQPANIPPAPLGQEDEDDVPF